MQQNQVSMVVTSAEVMTLPEEPEFKNDLKCLPHDFDEIMKAISTLDSLRGIATHLERRKLPDRAMLKLTNVQIAISETLQEFLETTTRL